MMSLFYDIVLCQRLMEERATATPALSAASVAGGVHAQEVVSGRGHLPLRHHGHLTVVTQGRVHVVLKPNRRPPAMSRLETIDPKLVPNNGTIPAPLQPEAEQTSSSCLSLIHI